MISTFLALHADLAGMTHSSPIILEVFLLVEHVRIRMIVMKQWMSSWQNESRL